MWREMAQTDKLVWTIAHESLPDLYSTWEPRIDFAEQADAYVLHAELPGMQRDDITVEYRDGMLTVRGEQTMASASWYCTAYKARLPCLCTALCPVKARCGGRHGHDLYPRCAGSAPAQSG